MVAGTEELGEIPVVELNGKEVSPSQVVCDKLCPDRRWKSQIVWRRFGSLIDSDEVLSGNSDCDMILVAFRWA